MPNIWWTDIPCRIFYFIFVVLMLILLGPTNFKIPQYTNLNKSKYESSNKNNLLENFDGFVLLKVIQNSRIGQIQKSDNLNTQKTCESCYLWQYRLWSFQAGGTELDRFLHRNQHTQRKLFNFEFWINGKLGK